MDPGVLEVLTRDFHRADSGVGAKVQDVPRFSVVAGKATRGYVAIYSFGTHVRIVLGDLVDRWCCNAINKTIRFLICHEN